MQGRDYLFCLQDKSFNFWKVENGIISKGPQPYFLKFAPDGWQDVSISNVRNKNYWGIDRSVTIPLNYLNDGSTILKYIFYTLGIEESVYLSIASQRLDYDTVDGAVNIDTLLPDQNNNYRVTGPAGQTVYLKLTPTTNTDVYLYLRVGTELVFYTSLLGGQSKVIEIPLSDSGYQDYTLYFSGDNVGIIPCTKGGSAVTTYGFWYKQIFRGEIDLSTYAHNGSKITASTLEDGLAKYLKANEGTVFEFPMNVPEAITVKMDGINLHNSLHYSDISALTISAAAYGRNFFGPCVYQSQEGDSTGVFFQTESLEKESNTFSTRMQSLNVVLTNAGTTPITVRMVGTFEIKITSVWPFGSGIKFAYINSLTDELNEYAHLIMDLPSLGIGDIGKIFTQAFDVSVYLQPGESLFRGGQFAQGSDDQTAFEFTDNSKYSIELITRREPTYIKFLRPQYLFEQLINKVTEGNFTAAISQFLKKYENKVFTSGNALRGFDDATLKIAFKDFFKDWDSYSFVGLNEKPAVDIDTKQNLIDAVNVVKLGEPKAGTFKVSVAKDYLFNEVDFGYPEVSSDVGTLNGNEEFNTKFVFSLGTTKAPAVLDKVSPIKTSCYTIEKIRVTQVDKDTTDYTNDNDTFAVWIESELQPASGIIPAHYNLDRSLNSGATGLIEPSSVFNMPSSPKRMLINNGPFIRSSLYLSDSKVLKFISSDKNNKLVAAGIVEKDDVHVGSLGAKFFNPVLFDFDIDPPDDLEDLLDLNPLQLFEFPFQGNTYLGILQKVSVSPSSRAAQSYQLLSYATNDLTKLIEYYGQ